MASVRSLGLHQPTAFQRTVDELAPPGKATTSSPPYGWEFTIDDENGEQVEDELLVTKTSVIWSRGDVFRKSFNFELEKEPVTQALITYFPAYEESRAPSSSNGSSHGARPALREPKLSKALFVVFRTQAHIHFVSGNSHVVHMPFEAEAVCAGPRGVIIQRKQRDDNLAPIFPKFPKVPPNSFVSSQTTAPSLRGSQQTVFSVEGLGNPKVLPLRLSSTLENMWEPQLDYPESRWPRLVSLMDPLQDLGLVVTAQPDTSTRHRRSRNASRSPYFLDPAEEILHIEEIKLPGSLRSSNPLILAITVNRETSSYGVWRLMYLHNGDPFIKQAKTELIKADRRRSSMQPNFASGASTPVQPNFRESFGAPLPGKRAPRKSEKFEKSDKGEKTDALDFVSSLDLDNDGGKGRRQSRRVSSMLARADLSASQEQPPMSHHAGSRRLESYGSHSQGPRLSGGTFGSLHYSQTIHPSLSSLLEAPVDNVLDELRAGGDFEGFHSMGLDDHGLDGLAQEVLLSKVYSIPMDNSNIRYSLSDQPARIQSKVFILEAPRFSVEDPAKCEIIIGFQDAMEKKLQLLTVEIRKGTKFLAPPRADHRISPNLDDLRLTCGQLRRAHPVVDSCKVTDGGLSAILILSEGHDNRRELSIQAPWLEKTPVSVPWLLLENERSLRHAGRVIDRDVGQRRSEAFEITRGGVIGLRYPRIGGIVDMVDGTDRHHQIQIQLQPRNPLVRKVLDACRSVLPPSHSKRMLPSWWNAMQWLRGQNAGVADPEWSALTIQLLALFLALGNPDLPMPSTTPRSAKSKRRAHSGSFGSIYDVEDWRTLQSYETPNALGYPPWQQARAWGWTVDDDEADGHSPDLADSKFLPRHVRFARSYFASSTSADVGNARWLSAALRRSGENIGNTVSNLAMALHLLLEEQKLDVMVPECASPGSAELRSLVCQLARWLRWHDMVSIYSLGIQDLPDSRPEYDIELPGLSLPQPPALFSDIIEWIRSCLTKGDRSPFPTLRNLYDAGTPAWGHEQQQPPDLRWDPITPRTLMFVRFFDKTGPRSDAVSMVEAMHAAGITKRVLETLPEAILTPLRDVISRCQPRPPASWSKELLHLVGRGDISLILETRKKPRSNLTDILAPTHNASWDFRAVCQSVEEYNSVGHDDADGTERQAVIRALFKDDRRLKEAQGLLSTHRPRAVRLYPQPGWTESEYLEKQKELVSRVATGTLAIPAGRALLYYGSRFPLLTQKLHIGGFNLNCIVRPTNVTVGVDKTQYTEEKVCWGFFHQGVAAGLAISPEAKGIDTSWILYNKPNQDLSNRHAGFLLALGLNGHLRDVAKWVAFKYLTPKHTMTSIGLLLGLAASYLGTMDSLITRLLSVHVTRMLPRGAAELNLSHLTQTTGIMGIGLLYCGSQHRRMSEIIMSEIEHVEEEDEEEPLRNECYRLAAGFSLGFINLGKGNDLKGLHDMRLTETLIAMATTTKKVEVVHVLDRAAAGAVMALALIYMKSEDRIVARKIEVPDSVMQFDYIRPDILLLRTVAKNLILWSEMEPTFDWISDNLPTAYRFRHRLTGTIALKSTDLPFFSILAGLCFSLALRFSGSGSIKVRDLLVHYLDQFMRVTRIAPTKRPPPLDHPVYDEELARSNARMCQDVLAMSVAIVMAGTGDLVALRRLRSLHGRDDADTPYGSHLAAHLAIGALFLGCGTATFGSSDLAIASLLVAFYPVLPVSVADNRSHLQAFRYFWVLATENRCLVTKDMATGQPVSVPVHIRMKPALGWGNTGAAADDSDDGVLVRTTPCLLPPLSDMASLRTSAGPAFWDVELDLVATPAVADALAKNQNLHLRRRPPQEAPFRATLRALGHDALTDATHDGTGLRHDPLAWMFRTDALRGLTHAERALVLSRGTGAEGGGAASGSYSAVDARLVLEQSVDGASRERLQGLRLLFDWVDTRRRMDVEEQGGGEKKGKAKDEKKAENLRMETRWDQGWWLRDSVIEALKGRVYLSGREE
ncbi:hypothetical protein SODALDRAFT_350637 [Sodiomyces alkalinus F11]|uniref:Uncharacterized protein n=1 Tax=Sodiomyces alkalinus (strain CBS 110278 / VKM F-3762 / F11) TaxID=1314773 RepID=A0A3N2PV72_SODAK|nr:hypothetical protein SODALDRAFT_350637 [Sodiomyces alkalinus F11]ROT38402.1 hypothetical protein SODALDRAFT_350637 [Sodiomyces alkalinus F11]